MAWGPGVQGWRSKSGTLSWATRTNLHGARAGGPPRHTPRVAARKVRCCARSRRAAAGPSVARLVLKRRMASWCRAKSRGATRRISAADAVATRRISAISDARCSASARLRSPCRRAAVPSLMARRGEQRRLRSRAVHLLSSSRLTRSGCGGAQPLGETTWCCTCRKPSVLPVAGGVGEGKTIVRVIGRRSKVAEGWRREDDGERNW